LYTVPDSKIHNSEIFFQKRKVDCTQVVGVVSKMPNQKHRKKKGGVNKNKKMQAMRAKEAQAKPAQKPTATGKQPGQTSKFEMLQDRPGALRRA
jgi:hypothetical protein